MFGKRGLFAVVIVCVFPFLLGSKTVDTSKIYFNHLSHYKDQGMACRACHRKPQSGIFTLSGHGECKICHRVKGKDEASCAVCHPGDNPESIGLLSKVDRINKDNRILYHSKKLLVLCEYCHREMLQGKVALGELLKSKEELNRLRRKSHRFPFFTNCADCHRDISRDKAPYSHKQENWKGQPHAEQAPEFNCRICHTKSYCQDCHEESY